MMPRAVTKRRGGEFCFNLGQLLFFSKSLQRFDLNSRLHSLSPSLHITGQWLSDKRTSVMIACKAKVSGSMKRINFQHYHLKDHITIWKTVTYIWYRLYMLSTAMTNDVGEGGGPAFQKCWLAGWPALFCDVNGNQGLMTVARLAAWSPLPRLWCWWCQIMVNRLHFSLEERTWGAEGFLQLSKSVVYSPSEQGWVTISVKGLTN